MEKDIINIQINENESEIVRNQQVYEPKPRIGSAIGFGKQDNCFQLMLCEYIDNSIASFENFQKINFNNFQNADFSKLNIEINLQTINLKNGNSEDKVIITDNAFGMNRQDLLIASEMYNDVNKSADSLNQHGIGMKSVSFWLGKNVTIYSKTLAEKHVNKLWMIFDKKLSSDPLKYNIGEVDQNYKVIKGGCGTTIIIEKLYENRFDIFKKTKVNISEDEQLIKKITKENNDKEKAIVNFLLFFGWKFKYYLQKNLNLKIIRTVFDEGKTLSSEQLIFNIFPFNIPTWNKTDFYSYLETKNKDIAPTKLIDNQNGFEDGLKELLNHKCECKKNNFDCYEFNNECDKIKCCYCLTEFIKGNKCLKCSLITNILDNEQAVIDIPIKIDLNGKDYLITNLAITAPNLKLETIAIKNNIILKDGWEKFRNVKIPYEKVHGLATFHHHRGINIGFNDDSKTKMPKTFAFSKDKKIAIDGTSTPRRLIGEIEFNDLPTEVNKTSIILNPNQTYNLQNELVSIWRKYFKDLLDLIIKAESLQATKKRKPKEKRMKTEKVANIGNNVLKKINQQVFNKQNLTFIKQTDGNYSWTYQNININGINYFFKLVNDNNINQPFIINKINEYENSYEIIYNYNHQLWSPLNDKEYDQKLNEFIHSILFIFTHLQNYLNQLDFETKIDLVKIIKDICVSWNK